MRIPGVDEFIEPFRSLVIHCMIQKGKNPDRCWRCNRRLTDAKRQIQHMKYDGATVDDLEFGCNGCNTVEEMTCLI